MIVTDTLIALTIFTAVLAISIILIATSLKNTTNNPATTNTVGGINPQNLRFVS
jgi:hypothetical protein